MSAKKKRSGAMAMAMERLRQVELEEMVTLAAKKKKKREAESSAKERTEIVAESALVPPPKKIVMERKRRRTEEDLPSAPRRQSDAVIDLVGPETAREGVAAGSSRAEAHVEGSLSARCIHSRPPSSSSSESKTQDFLEAMIFRARTTLSPEVYWEISGLGDGLLGERIAGDALKLALAASVGASRLYTTANHLQTTEIELQRRATEIKSLKTELGSLAEVFERGSTANVKLKADVAATRGERDKVLKEKAEMQKTLNRFMALEAELVDIRENMFKCEAARLVFEKQSNEKDDLLLAAPAKAVAEFKDSFEYQLALDRRTVAAYEEVKAEVQERYPDLDLAFLLGDDADEPMTVPPGDGGRVSSEASPSDQVVEIGEVNPEIASADVAKVPPRGDDAAA